MATPNGTYLPGCIDFWHGASLGLGDWNLFTWSLWGHRWPCLKET